MSWTPPPTRPPGYVVKDVINAPIDIQEETAGIYREGFTAGWVQAASDYSAKKTAKTIPIKVGVSDVYPAPEPPPWNKIPEGNEYGSGLGEWIYKRGFIDGWEASTMAYIRDDRPPPGP